MIPHVSQPQIVKYDKMVNEKGVNEISIFQTQKGGVCFIYGRLAQIF